MTPVLPTVNAILNATAAVLLVWGYRLIRRKRIQTAPQGDDHGVHHLVPVPGLLPGLSRAGGLRALPAPGRDPHGVLDHPRHPHRAGGHGSGAGHHHAAPRPGAALRHASRIARWTLPIWLYVSVTGVVVYLMLYHM